MKKKLSTRLLTGLFVMGMAANASATVLNEVGDVGESLATAGEVPGGTDHIYGSLSGDADLWHFSWGGGDFYANTVNPNSGSQIDDQLFLFDSAGIGIQGNDDGIAIAGPAYLQVTSLPLGDYFLGISSWDYDPRDAGGNLMFPTFPFETLYSPIDSDPLHHWDGMSYHSGDYAINFQQIDDQGNPVDRAPVPEPTTMLLFGTGLAGLAGSRLRRKKTA